MSTTASSLGRAVQAVECRSRSENTTAQKCLLPNPIGVTPQLQSEYTTCSEDREGEGNAKIHGRTPPARLHSRTIAIGVRLSQTRHGRNGERRHTCTLSGINIRAR